MPSQLTPVPDPAPPIRLPLGKDFEMPPLRDRWTKEGTCRFREVAVPIWADHAMMGIWKKNSLAFKERGYGVQQIDGKWFLQQWLLHRHGANYLTAIGQERLDVARNGGKLALEQKEITVELQPLPAWIEAKLYDFQIAPARQLFRALLNGNREWGYAGAWDTSDLGTGKTFQTLAAAIAVSLIYGLEIAVVCPLAVIGARPTHTGKGSGWLGAFAHFGVTPRFVLNYETLRTGNRDHVKMVNYTDPEPKKRFEWQLDPRKTIILFDEAHKLKKTGTLNQGLAMAALRQRFPVIFISGTLGSEPTHMRATGRAVGLHKGAEDYTKFLTNHGCTGVHKSGKNWKFCGGDRGRKLLQIIHNRVFPMRGARTRIEDLGDRFPETQIILEAYETGDAAGITKAFNEARHAIERLNKQGDINEEEKQHLGLAALIRAWQASERAKVPGIIETAEEELDAGRHVAVFVNFTETRTTLMDKFGTLCGIYGGQSIADRTKCIDDFQSDKEPVIVANTEAGGVGVSLHDLNGNYPRTSIILPTWKAEVLKQALGRVHRAGGLSRSRQIIMFAAGTVEEQICDAARTKIANIDTLNDGDLYPAATF